MIDSSRQGNGVGATEIQFTVGEHAMTKLYANKKRFDDFSFTIKKHVPWRIIHNIKIQRVSRPQPAVMLWLSKVCIYSDLAVEGGCLMIRMNPNSKIWSEILRIKGYNSIITDIKY